MRKLCPHAANRIGARINVLSLPALGDRPGIPKISPPARGAMLRPPAESGLRAQVIDGLMLQPDFQSRPSSLASAFHLLSIEALVFPSIRISSGQGRVKPSLSHFRVASM